jgi:hypothetical protein
METQSKNRDYSRLSLPAGASNSLCKTKGQHGNPKQKSRLFKAVLCTANQVKFLNTGLRGPTGRPEYSSFRQSVPRALEF